MTKYLSESEVLGATALQRKETKSYACLTVFEVTEGHAAHLWPLCLPFLNSEVRGLQGGNSEGYCIVVRFAGR